LSPISIFISGFHGTTDPIHVALTLLTLFVAERYSRPWLTGAVLAMAMSIKVIPLIFIPMIVFDLPTIRKRVEFLVVLGTVFIALSLPYIVQDPMLVIGRVFGYRSLYGFWGFPRLLSLLEAAVPLAAPLSLLYYGLGRFVILFAVTYLGEGLAKAKAQLFPKAALVAFFFMTFTPGFGIQYLVWLVPWTACINLQASLAYHLIGGAFIATVYTSWSGGLPWDLADSSGPTFWGVGWRGPALLLELATWVIVIWMWRLARGQTQTQSKRISPTVRA
jgi:uncharacterized membrane protein